MTQQDEGEGMRMTLDQRIEAAARALAVAHGTDPDALGPGQSHTWNDPATGVGHIMTDHRGPLWTMWVTDAKAALRAGFPELFASPAEAWLAPWALDGNQRVTLFLGDGWEALRNSHINPKD